MYIKQEIQLIKLHNIIEIIIEYYSYPSYKDHQLMDKKNLLFVPN